MKEVYYLDKLEGKAIFKDGTEQEADVVILCTVISSFSFFRRKFTIKN